MEKTISVNGEDLDRTIDASTEAKNRAEELLSKLQRMLEDDPQNETLKDLFEHMAFVTEKVIDVREAAYYTAGMDEQAKQDETYKNSMHAFIQQKAQDPTFGMHL